MAALFENACILLAAFTLARLIDGLPVVTWQYAALLAAALVLQAVAGAFGRELLTEWSGRVRLAYRRRLHGMLQQAVEPEGSLAAAKEAVGQENAGQDIRRNNGGCDRLAELCCEPVDALDEFFQKVIPLAVTGAVRLPLFLAVFFYLDAVSGLIALVTMPVAPVLLYLLGRMTARASEAQWDRQSELNRGFYELMQGAVTLKLFRRTGAALKEMEALSRSYSASSLQVLRVAFLSAFAVELMTTLSIAVLAVGIGLRILSGDLDFFTGFFVLLLAPDFFMPIRSAGMAFHVIMDTKTALERNKSFLQQYNKMDVEQYREISAGMPAGIQLSAGMPVDSQITAGMPADIQVSAEMPVDSQITAEMPADTQILAKMPADTQAPAKMPADMQVSVGMPADILIPAGSFAVITGSSGAGKTTLLKRMAGLLPSGDDHFLVAGYSLEKLPDGLRRQVIGYVPQEPHVYAASLRDNLLLGRSFSDARLEEMLALAGLGSWYRSAGGMDIMLGDGGVSLSNGQRHRLGLARALIASPPVLLLDEVTAGLEEQEEKKMLDTLLRSLAGTTILLATHRRQAIRRAAQVIEVIP